MVNNIPVNGWPQLKDLEAVQPILNRLDKIEAWKRTVKEETFTGEVITIDNALALPVRSLKTTINAIQDLHGLPFPYVGGAYKNQFNKDTVVVGYVRSADGTIAENADYKASDYIPVIAGQNYTISGTDFSGGNSGAFYDANKDFISGIVTSPFTVTVPNNAAYMRITMLAGSIGTAQVEKGTTATSYAPYSNLCPISGRTAAVLTRSDGDEISEDFTIQLGTTVYGAKIDWDMGVASITHVLLVNNTADMDNSEDWPGWRTSGIRQYIGGGINRVFTGQTMNVGMVYGANTTGNDDTLILPKDTYNLSQTEWKALSTDVQIIVPLATPTTIQFTPEQLEMLKGYNHITLTDGYGTIEFKALTGANWS